MNEIVMKARADDVKKAGAQFDLENKDIEEALQDLFKRYPDNSSITHVLLKATTLNFFYWTQIRLYSARTPTILEVAHHIASLRIDSDLRLGSPELVGRIAKIQVPEKEARFYYSFATKYCSWHNPNSYPINDSRVRLYLSYLRDHGCLNRFSEAALWDYPVFKRIVEDLREKNDLQNFTFKEIDKFLYLQGGKLLMGRSERKVEEDETILVPVPGQAGEMEWSVENYSSLEEAELSRKKFTDSSGWVKVKPEMNETELELQFDEDMRGIIAKEQELRKTIWKGTPPSTRFMGMIERHGGRKMAKILLTCDPPKGMIGYLRKSGHLDMTMEHYVVMDKYKLLFTDDERAIAQFRLDHED
jgi:hypothetical protein